MTKCDECGEPIVTTKAGVVRHKNKWLKDYDGSRFEADKDHQAVHSDHDPCNDGTCSTCFGE